MVIRGLQKLTLLDYPGKVACTVFTDGCNFACPFCHNASLVHRPDVPPVNAAPAISPDEVLAFLKKRQGILDGICVTGGEPLLQAGLTSFLEQVKALGYRIKLDTNGSLPARLKDLVARDLVDYIAMDIKNAPDKYAETIGRRIYDLTQVRESVEFLRSLPGRYEFRTTVVREFHTDTDFEQIGTWLAGAERYFLQSFIDSGDILSPGLHAHEPETLRSFLTIVQKTIPTAALRGVD
jgi:pyruvate formate lyase activating enzyme